MEENWRLTLAWKELKEVPHALVEKYSNCRYLDLTNNNIDSIETLGGFKNLEVLILDGNKISEKVKFPKMDKLHTLWLNRCKVLNLALLLDQLEIKTTNLRHLSLLNNDGLYLYLILTKYEACPNYFNGGSLKQYNDYRMYTIARFPLLIELDDRKITQEERTQANSLYSSKENRDKRNQNEEKRIQELEDLRKQKKLQQKAKTEEEKRQRDEAIQKFKKEKEQKEKLAQILPSLRDLDLKTEKKEVLPPKIVAQELPESESESDSDEEDN